VTKIKETLADLIRRGASSASPTINAESSNKPPPAPLEVLQMVTPHGRPVMAPNALTDAVTDLEGGASLKYYTGDLAADRYISKEDIFEDDQQVKSNKNAISEVANTAHRLAEIEELGFLTQRRVKFAIFDYIFTKSKQKA
jgi:hypothetical protein